MERSPFPSEASIALFPRKQTRISHGCDPTSSAPSPVTQSRCFHFRGHTTVPTYLVLGLAAAYLNLLPRPAIVTFNTRLMVRLAKASVLFILATYLFVRVMSV